MTEELIVVGGGLAGSEAAWQAAELGIRVKLYEMRPEKTTPAHVTNYLAELVCSNSLGSTLVNKAPGLLKAELRGLDSLILRCAEDSAVPAGSALAVDRELFAERVTTQIESHPNIDLIHEEMPQVPLQPTIICSGPLTSNALADSIGKLTGQRYLYFYDALSPIVSFDSIDFNYAYRASRYDRGEQLEGDYINCPLNEEEYKVFYEALVSAEQISLRDFEREDAQFFEGCLPVEIMAKRNRDSLRFPSLRPAKTSRAGRSKNYGETLRGFTTKTR
jgi:methylenetetrahydrofolate--tRNA-(uracil-5-)-methyltransferase